MAWSRPRSSRSCSKGDHLARLGKCGQCVGMAEHRLGRGLGRRVVEVFGQKARRDAEFEGSLVGHARDLTRADDAEAIEGRQISGHASDSSRIAAR